MTGIKQIIGGQPCLTKEAVRAKCQRIMRETNGGSIEDRYQFAFLCDLFGRHPHAEQKVGLGIDIIFVKAVTPYNTRAFHIRRHDGTVTDISYEQCIAPKTDTRTLYNALRIEVWEQVAAFRDRAFTGKFTILCPYTREMLFRNTCHVDHRPPQTFKVIADRWIELEGGPDRVRLRSGDGDLGSRLANVQQVGRWQQYHRKKANLRVVSEQANLKHIPAEVRAA